MQNTTIFVSLRGLIHKCQIRPFLRNDQENIVAGPSLHATHVKPIMRFKYLPFFSQNSIQTTALFQIWQKFSIFEETCFWFCLIFSQILACHMNRAYQAPQQAIGDVLWP